MPKDDARIRDRVRDGAVAAGQRLDQGLPRASGAAARPRRFPADPRRPREPRPQSVHRRRRAAPRHGELHGVRARRSDVGRRLSGRRREGRGAVRQGRSREDDRRLRRRGQLAEGASRVAPASSARSGSASAAASRTRWRSACRTSARPCRSTARCRRRRTCRRSRPRSSCTTASWTRGSRRRGRPTTQALKAAGVPHEGYIYPKAQHGFHNDTTPRYDEAAAKLAWQRTLDWFNKYVKATS